KAFESGSGRGSLGVSAAGGARGVGVWGIGLGTGALGGAACTASGAAETGAFSAVSEPENTLVNPATKKATSSPAARPPPTVRTGLVLARRPSLSSICLTALGAATCSVCFGSSNAALEPLGGTKSSKAIPSVLSVIGSPEGLLGDRILWLGLSG